MKAIILLAVVGTIVMLGIIIPALQNAQHAEKYSEAFSVDATFYPEQKQVEITFNDRTEKTRGIVLEILGMEQSFQRQFDVPSFSVNVPFDAEPQHGWRSMPVTFVVEHEEFGRVGIKIDIHDKDEPAGNVIFSKL